MDDGHLQITTNKKRAPLKGHNALNVELAARKPGIIKTDWSACARQRQAYKTKVTQRAWFDDHMHEHEP